MQPLKSTYKGNATDHEVNIAGVKLYFCYILLDCIMYYLVMFSSWLREYQLWLWTQLELHSVLCQGQPTLLLCTVPRTHCTRDYCQCGLSIQKSEESHLKESFISHGRLSPVWSTKSEPGTVCPLISIVIYVFNHNHKNRIRYISYCSELLKQQCLYIILLRIPYIMHCTAYSYGVQLIHCYVFIFIQLDPDGTWEW